MPTSIRLEPEIERRLDFLAASTGRSKAYYLRRIIERGRHSDLLAQNGAYAHLHSLQFAEA